MTGATDRTLRFAGSGIRAATSAVTWKSGALAPRKASRFKLGFSRHLYSAQFFPQLASRNKRRLRESVISLLLLFVTVAALATPAAAKSWRISNLQDTITVNADGSALVNETITLAFAGEFHGIHWMIPIEYPGANQTNYELFVEL